METIPKSNEGVPATESKPWQKGFQIDYLKDLEKRFKSYNEYAQHEMSKFKKNNIAEALSKGELQLLGKGLIHYSQVKDKSNISTIAMTIKELVFLIFNFWDTFYWTDIYN